MDPRGREGLNKITKNNAGFILESITHTHTHTKSIFGAKRIIQINEKREEEEKGRHAPSR